MLCVGYPSGFGFAGLNCDPYCLHYGNVITTWHGVKAVLVPLNPIFIASKLNVDPHIPRTRT
jgi:hypothetical protein